MQIYHISQELYYKSDLTKSNNIILQDPYSFFKFSVYQPHSEDHIIPIDYNEDITIAKARSVSWLEMIRK